MKDSVGLGKIGRLLESVTRRNRSFLDKCANTRLLAVSNPRKAYDEYRTLAHELVNNSKNFGGSDACTSYIEEIQCGLDSSSLDTNLLTLMQELKKSYLEDVLRPAVRVYLSGEGPTKDEIGELYEPVLYLNELTETLDFLSKLRTG